MGDQRTATQRLNLAQAFNPNNNIRGIINLVTNMAIIKQQIYIYGHGNYLRDYIYIDDVVQANIKACKPKKNGITKSNFLYFKKTIQ